MEKLFRIFCVISITSVVSHCQVTDKYSIAQELKVLKPELLRNVSNRKLFAGAGGSELSFLLFEKNSNPSIYNYNIKRQLLKKNQGFKIEGDAKIVNALLNDSLVVLVGIRNAPKEFKNLDVTEIPIENFEYQDLWINVAGAEFQLDKLPDHVIDRSYHLAFAPDGKFLTCNPYSSRSAGYDPSAENFFLVYDLRDLRNFTKSKLACERCLNSTIVGDNVFFEMELPIGGGFDDYNSNVYMAPLGNIKDTTLISTNTKLIHVDSNLKFVLGEKTLFGKKSLIFVDLKTKSFQYLLGRDYSALTFYSSMDKRLYFDFGNYIISIKHPDQFPFNALSRSKQRTTLKENRSFWEKYSILD